MNRRRGWAAVALLAALTAGCTAEGRAPTPTPGAPAPASPPVPASTAPASPTPTPSEADYTPPPGDDSPDPTTAGDLSAASLPREILGFRAAVVEPEEGEFDPNGSWVHAMDAEQAGIEAMTACGPETPVPTPRAALQASYRDGDRTGGGMALQFADDDLARNWFAAYRSQVEQCPADQTEEAAVVIPARRGGEQWLADRRILEGASWSEAARRRGDTVLLVMVDDAHRSSLDELGDAARGLGQ